MPFLLGTIQRESDRPTLLLSPMGARRLSVAYLFMRYRYIAKTQLFRTLLRSVWNPGRALDCATFEKQLAPLRSISMQNQDTALRADAAYRPLMGSVEVMREVLRHVTELTGCISIRRAISAPALFEGAYSGRRRGLVSVVILRFAAPWIY